jgi:hypothetical protein
MENPDAPREEPVCAGCNGRLFIRYYKSGDISCRVKQQSIMQEVLAYAATCKLAALSVTAAQLAFYAAVSSRSLAAGGNNVQSSCSFLLCCTCWCAV